ncbi:MAG: metallophosphatase family protein [Spirochaetaceae bacterium]|jgi:predicted phosphodiesterase|nr:metallophosphatase family protein [Spirochaetaceae bacterium]
MRVLVISDIHANLAAFQAVLKKARGEYDEIFCLGDLVGYGSRPNECVELAAQSCSLVLAGNHDLAVGGVLDYADFSERAKKSAQWTSARIRAQNRAYLAGLLPRETRGDMVFSHGGPESPVWSYILSEDDAEYSFQSEAFRVCVFGHTHIPSVFVRTGGNEKDARNFSDSCQAVYGLPELSIDTHETGLRIMINPGSVGFPRDAADGHTSARLDRAAARYALFDLRTGVWIFKRIEYDLKAGAREMVREGLW